MYLWQFWLDVKISVLDIFISALFWVAKLLYNYKYDFLGLIKIKVWFLCGYSSYMRAFILWIFCPSVCQSGYKGHKCILTSISRLLFKLHVLFFVVVKIALVKDHLSYEYFVCRYKMYRYKNVNFSAVR